jgi:hypothetical protein
VLLLLASCAQVRPADPAVAIESLQVACESSCAGITTANVTIPAGWSLASDPDGLCLKKDSRILCATCDCNTYGLMAAELISASAVEHATLCTFTGDEDAGTLTAVCV